MSRRNLAATISESLGLTALFEKAPRRNSILVLNYHRVGDTSTCEYDRDVFSCSAEQFQDQIRYLKRHFHVSTLDEVRYMVENPSELKGFHVLLTFDDGYRDSFEVVLPILKAEGLQATFFLTTSYLGTEELPWWDQIAYIVRLTNRTTIQFEHRDIQVAGRNRDAVVRDVLRLCGYEDTREPVEFLIRLAEACETSLSTVPKDTAFMTWEQAQQLLAAGMTVGSHTVSHPILSRISPEQQYAEMVTSKRLLETRLECVIDSISYPVGIRSAFNEQTMKAAQDAGYKLAFSFYGGLNTPDRIDRYNLLRVGVEQHVSMPVLRLQTALAASVSKAI